ncbi:hypothetical protein SVIOM342S_00395 [Streptomyces violaceorubidus]
MAALGSIGTALYRHGVPSDAPAPAEETLGGALAVAAELPGRAAGDALATAAREAFTDGMQGAAIAGALLLLGAAVSAALGLLGTSGCARRRRRQTPDRPTNSARPAFEDKARSGP